MSTQREQVIQDSKLGRPASSPYPLCPMHGRRILLAFGGLLLLLGLTLSWTTTLPTHAGTVLLDGQPASGVRVRWQGERDFVLTDTQGRFRLPAGPGRSLFTLAHPSAFIGSAQAQSLPAPLSLRRLPATDHPDYAWVSSHPSPTDTQACAHCHGEIHREWQASAHARSATGLHFRNLYEGTDAQGRADVGWNLLKENPDGSAVCSACHAPTAEQAAALDLRQVRDVASQGVHCDYCHKIASAGLGEPGLTFGKFGLELLRPESGQLFFGPLDDVARDEDVYAPFYRQSQYCAACHEGVVLGVHVYSTYSEWLASPARAQGKQCQTCHMTPTGRMTNIAPGRGGHERPADTLANHRFFQGDLVQMLKQSLQLELTPTRHKETIEIAFTLTAKQVGHRVPTGFIDRHLLLVVEAQTAAGQQILPRVGPTLTARDGPEHVGKAGRFFGRVASDEQGRAPLPFWAAPVQVSDTRLFPDRPERGTWTYPGSAQSLRVRVWYRKFWPEVAASKGWSENEVLVLDRQVLMSDHP